MGRIDDAIRTLGSIEDGTERALQLAGLISTLFKIKGVVLLVTGQLAFDSYANTSSEYPELELGVFAGDLAPRAILEIMRGQLYAEGSLYHWMTAGIPVRFQPHTSLAHRELCREFTTLHGVVKLLPVEEIAADYILASVHPEPDEASEARARLLLANGLAEAFQMDWPALHALCHRPEYRVGEELARLRLAAKKEVDALGTELDQIGETPTLPKVEVPAPSVAPPLPLDAFLDALAHHDDDLIDGAPAN
jgi:hypothetical protein